MYDSHDYKLENNKKYGEGGPLFSFQTFDRMIVAHDPCDMKKANVICRPSILLLSSNEM